MRHLEEVTQIEHVVLAGRRASAQTPTAPFIILVASFQSTRRPKSDSASLRRNRPRKRVLKRRTEAFNRIIVNAPKTFTGPQLRVLLRALIQVDAYDFTDDVAAHFVGDDENNQQDAEEVLLLHRASPDLRKRSLNVYRAGIGKPLSGRSERSGLEAVRPAARFYELQAENTGRQTDSSRSFFAQLFRKAVRAG